jgi:hypothetical protein
MHSRCSAPPTRLRVASRQEIPGASAPCASLVVLGAACRTVGLRGGALRPWKSSNTMAILVSVSGIIGGGDGGWFVLNWDRIEDEEGDGDVDGKKS